MQGLPFPNRMIRERVATNGQIRPLEEESKLTALHWPAEVTCVITEPALRRFLEGQAIWDEKYAKTTRKVATQRQKTIQHAQKDMIKLVAKMEAKLKTSFTGADSSRSEGHAGSVDPSSAGMSSAASHTPAVLNAPSFSWAWALESENPPPSSLVARRDTAGERINTSQ